MWQREEEQESGFPRWFSLTVLTLSKKKNITHARNCLDTVQVFNFFSVWVQNTFFTIIKKHSMFLQYSTSLVIEWKISIWKKIGDADFTLPSTQIFTYFYSITIC